MRATRKPSIRTLSSVFDDPKEARRVLTMSRSALEYLPAAKARIDACHHRPDTSDVRMHALNALDAGLHGVETMKMGDEYADYLNTGDSYAATLIYWRGRFRVQSCGDFIEVMERRGVRAD